MIRTFGAQTLTGSAQPFFGDALTAAVVAQPQNNQNYQNQTIISVASTAKYRIGDYLIIDDGSASQEGCCITTIPSSTTLSVSGLQFAHATSAIIALDILCYTVSIQYIGSGFCYLGTDNTVTTVPGGNVFAELSTQGVWTYPPSVNYNGLRSGYGWIIGTSGQKFLAYAVII
jgi:hypothetical protein